MKRYIILFGLITAFLSVFALNKNDHLQQYKHVLNIVTDYAIKSDSLSFFKDRQLNLNELDSFDYPFANNLEQYFTLTEMLIQKEIFNKYKTYFPLPAQDYPLFDEENTAGKAMEMNLLLDAWDAILYDKLDTIQPLLEKFFSLRRVRWTNNWSYLMPFEQNEEIRLGYSTFLAYELINNALNNLDSLPKDEQKSLKSYFKDENPMDYLYKLILSFSPTNDQAINAINNSDLKLSGVLQFIIFKELGWKSDSLARRDLWYVLNDKMAISDSLRKAYVKDIKDSEPYRDILLQIKAQNAAYSDKYSELLNEINANENTEFSIKFDRILQEIYPPQTHFYISKDGKSQLFNELSDYQINNKKLQFKTTNNTIIKTYGNNSTSIKWKSNSHFRVYADDKPIRIDQDFDLEFNKLEIKSHHFSIIIDTLGTVSFQDNKLAISMPTQSKYNVSPAWWDYLDELRAKLELKGIPSAWFIEQVNNDDFKVYLNMKRLFTNMPEHRASRGEITTTDYIKNFGVAQKITRADAFISEYKAVLEKAEKKNGIHYEMILGILAIESDYGNPRHKGTFYTFPALVSQYMLLPWRERFSTNELVALYEFSNLISKDPYHFIGSYAGAAGWGQFIPSSMKTFFLDSNDDFADIDIYSLDDNIVSIENYLFKNGLSGKNIDNYKARYNAVYSYNHSDYYVKAVLQIYDQLREKRLKKK
ncbi:MAG TPA: lytic murein transglycosylase [Candidatus Cloacimonadota bacterium]|nr:lytic murein transglycosylase [Candidatus Cloacimonadota bacterium]